MGRVQANLVQDVVLVNLYMYICYVLNTSIKRYIYGYNYIPGIINIIVAVRLVAVCIVASI